MKAETPVARTIRCRHIAAVAATLVALTGTAKAESLKDAWSMAIQSNEAVAAAHSDRDAAEADRTAANRLRWPVVDVSGAYTQFANAPILDIATSNGQLQAPIWRHDGYTTAGAQMTVPIWTAGKISGAIAAATAGALGASAIEVRSTADLKLAVTETYVAIFRARRALEVAESAVASLSAHAGDVQILYDKQAVPQSDVLAAQVALANASQQRLRAANFLSLANATYNRWVNQPLDRVPDLEEPGPGSSLVSADPLDALIAQALEHRPELEAAQAQQTGLEQAARSERAQGLPQIVLQAGYNHLDNEILDRQNFASVAVGFQWRLFDSGQLEARTQALRSRARAAQQRLADLRSSIRLEVESSFLNREDAAARSHATIAAVAQSEENLRIAKELYLNGLGTNNQVLDAEALRIVALTNRDDANCDVLVANYRLLRAIGSL